MLVYLSNKEASVDGAKGKRVENEVRYVVGFGKGSQIM